MPGSNPGTGHAGVRQGTFSRKQFMYPNTEHKPHLTHSHLISLIPF